MIRAESSTPYYSSRVEEIELSAILNNRQLFG